jgi:hypothetical protein
MLQWMRQRIMIPRGKKHKHSSRASFNWAATRLHEVGVASNHLSTILGLDVVTLTVACLVFIKLFSKCIIFSIDKDVKSATIV